MISLLFLVAIIIACGDLFMGYVIALSNEPSQEDKTTMKRKKAIL